ncbi:MAG TPA: sigma 54-interacting transcriptional regulator [Terriglobales bacterium]|jgi:transcriptional regulator with PAS, ATPase and Fis domain|nr:sigma 54-interacting transcriptional regulator [Terriglobales bacterium]
MQAARRDPPNDTLRETFAQLGFVTASDAMIPVLRAALKAASASDITVLVEGETGTGKQVLAQAIHRLDPKRANHPFVTAHCSTIHEALAESELFGHCRGAFTGAVTQRSGLFQTANHGTLFLDEINDLPLGLQPKLLDVIQRRVVRPMGADREISVSVRIIAASNQPLQPLVLQNRFRSDLYYRLNVVRLRLPLLRDRPDDLAGLVSAFAARYESVYQPIASVEQELVSFLRRHAFTGNIRELENAVVRMLFAKDHGTSLGLEDWFAQAGNEKPDEDRDLIGEAAENLWQFISRSGLSYSEAIQTLEKKVLTTALVAGGRTRREVARKLRTSERTLYHMIRTHRLSSPPGV